MTGPSFPTAGVRLQTTLLSTAVVALALLLGGVVLASAMRLQLTEGLRRSAEARAQDLAFLASEGALPEILPEQGALQLAQVLAADGSVLAASAAIAGRRDALAERRLVPGERIGRPADWPDPADEPGAPSTELEPAWLVGRGTDTPDGPVTVLVLASLEPVEDALDVLLPLLYLLLPALLLATAVAAWVMTGRALAPVTAIRARAEAISAADLKQRVPVPPAEDEIRQLALTVNRMLDRIQAASDAQRRFVSDASHELRSPVAAIRTMLEVAIRHPGAVEAGELHGDLLHESLRLERLAQDLLLLARQDERGLRLRPMPVDLSDLLREEAAAGRARQPLPIELTVDADVTLLADAEQLRRLLRNLVDNALQHADSGVWIEAGIEPMFGTGREPGRATGGATGGAPGGAPAEPSSVSDAPSTVWIRISDDGPGVPEAERERIFERFVRLDASRSRHAGGAGLGLAVCRAIAEAHGGSLKVVEPRRGGASIELRLAI